MTARGRRCEPEEDHGMRDDNGRFSDFLCSAFNDKRCSNESRACLVLTDAQETANKVAETDDVEKKANFEHALLEEDSPYFEVRATVRNYDQEMPANTIRAWIIGLTATTIVSAVNLLFSLRNPSISIYVYVVQLLAYPVGCGMARVSHCISSWHNGSISQVSAAQRFYQTMNSIRSA